ncbi:hypothetical protein MLD38_031850 [Melastoma candidum]|uniref:Uncharacterized protein n=1 Tax=Melastoma candidum TaxID=119954 RepID=A0ACB9MS38_9MYRT|nr:hypothetical protein MLD38_031850 [Melastoma candidum]
MGGYGWSRMIGGILPVDKYYRDAVVLELGDDRGRRWREVGNMWEIWERVCLGKVAIVEGDEFHVPKVFMLENDDIFRYNMDINRWQKESTLPRKGDSSLGFISLKGELCVLTSLDGVRSIEARRPRPSDKV